MIKLAKRIETYFDLVELDSLMFNMGILPDTIAGTTIQAKAKNLVVGCSKTGTLDTLVSYCREMRTQVRWDVPKPIQQTNDLGIEQRAMVLEIVRQMNQGKQLTLSDGEKVAMRPDMTIGYVNRIDHDGNVYISDLSSLTLVELAKICIMEELL